MIIDGCFVSFKHKICLIHIYKNASISFRDTFDMRGKYYKFKSKEVQENDLVKVTILRDPINRIISIYLYMLRGEDFGFPDQHNVKEIEKMDFFREQDLKKSFELFIKKLKNGFFSAVALPQTCFLKHRDLDIKDLDFIFIQENIDNDFKVFITKYNIKNVKFHHNNKGNEENTKILLNYIKNNESIINDIKKLYKEDFILYEKALNFISK